MGDNQNVAEESAVETTTQVSSPQTEVSSTETQTPQESATQAEVSDVSTQTEEERRDFQIRRLAEENRRLKDEKEARAKHESAFNAFRPTQVPTTGVQIENYQDPSTGEVNWQAYNYAMVQTAQQAAQVAAQATTQDLMDEQSARTKHPDLFSDPEVEQEIADRWVAAKLRGENRTISQITDAVAQRYGKVSSKVEKAAMEKVLTQVTEKEQAALAAPAQTSAPARQAVAQSDLEDLRVATRFGKTEATAVRMKSIPWANK